MNWRKRDWLGAAATVFALAVTFNAEYEIATAVHINPIVAYAVPGALDVYVLRALQVKRDVFLTVLAMVAVNAASHLVTAGVLAVSPVLIVAVSAIAPLVLWRAHVLRHSAGTEQVVFPVPEHVPETVWEDGHSGGVVCTCSRCVPPVPEHVPETIWERDQFGNAVPAVPAFEEHADQAVSIVSPGPVNVPEHDDLEQIERSWRAEYREHSVPEWDGNIVDATEHNGERVLSLVPPLPAGFLPVLEDGDKEFLDRARVLDVPSIRALKGLGMGNARAQRIQQYLKTEHTEEQS